MSKIFNYILPLLLFCIGGYFLFFYHNESTTHPQDTTADTTAVQYISCQGPIFGTYYHIRYRHQDNIDLQPQITAALQDVDHSLSMFNPKSLLSRINSNATDSVDENFLTIYNCASTIWQTTEHAFDITVAPLVDLWGFGRQERQDVSDSDVKKLLPAVGMDKIHLKEHRLTKDNSLTRIDCSAIAKGFGTDKAAQVLIEHGCTDFIVEIGGEIVTHGKNEHGEPWHIGINTPADDPDNTSNDIQQVVELKNAALATSGNYRRFYEIDGKRISHTIDPRTGYPAYSDILSATVIAPTCMQADAYATAFMVLGSDKALKICQQDTTISCLLITAGDTPDKYRVLKSENFSK